jgi:putative ABC transport system substrate-binding protein
MKRREFIMLLGGAAVAWPVAVRAQQPSNIPRVGVLRFGPAAAYVDRVEALRSGLRQLGYVEGKNIAIEYVWTETADRLDERAAELVRMNVDIIFATSSTEVEAARKATMTVPIVFATYADPVGVGHVANLAQPGGNITGLSMLLTELVAKELEILKEALPGIQLVITPARAVEDFEEAFSTMSREQVAGFVAVATPPTLSHRERLAELAQKHRLPSMFGTRENVEAGGLMSYAPDLRYMTRLAATYIDKILKGAKPADLPVEQASKYQLVINLKTAKALGLEVPPLLLARADEVIE